MIENGAKLSKGKRGRGYVGRVRFSTSKIVRGKFWEAENLLLAKVEQARERGLTVGFSACRVWMKNCMETAYAEQSQTFRLSRRIDQFKATRNWFSRFLSRNGYVHRRPTNKKATSVGEKLPKIQRWHRRYQHFISQPGGVNDEIFGRYTPGNILNVDQVGMNLTERGVGSTISKKGTKVIRISTKKGSDKRFCTLQVCISMNTVWRTDEATGEVYNSHPQPRIAMIVRGKGKRISDAEIAGYHPDVDVYYQVNAWMNEDVQEQWAKKTLMRYCNEQLVAEDDKMLILDNLSCQTSESFGDLLGTFKVDRRLLPTDTTDNIQPVDQHIGIELKKLAAAEQLAKLQNDDAFAADWLGVSNGTYPAWKTRVAVTHFVGEAWKKLIRKRDFLHTGLRTGCVMVREGVRRVDHGLAEIKIDGVESYEFENFDMGEPAPTTAGDNLVEAEESATSEAEEATAESNPLPEPSGRSKKKKKVKPPQRRILEQSESADEAEAEECEQLANDSSVETDIEALYEEH